MPAALAKFLTALSGALVLSGLLLISTVFWPPAEDPHGGMFVAAFGLWVGLPTGAWLYLLVLSVRRRSAWRRVLLPLPAMALIVVMAMELGGVF